MAPLFSQLVQALEAFYRHQEVKPGDSVSLRQLCKSTGLSPEVWFERIQSPGVGLMVKEELTEAGWQVQQKFIGRGPRLSFVKE